jgi:hypothetical protein
MPYRAQLSSVNVIHCTDINNDGLTDIITGGNKSGFPPQLQKLDASFGDVFMNKGNATFEWISNRSNNLRVEGEVRDIEEVATRTGRLLIFLRNDQYPKMFRLNEQEKK